MEVTKELKLAREVEGINNKTPVSYKKGEKGRERQQNKKKMSDDDKNSSSVRVAVR